MMTNPDRAIPFKREDGALLVGGIPADRLAERVGATPFFAYDRALISERVSTVRAVLPDRIDLSYAVKANPMPAVLQHMSGLVDGFDVASAGELREALNTTTPAEYVSFAGPGKTTDELRQAVAAGVTVELESENELARVRAEDRRAARRRQGSAARRRPYRDGVHSPGPRRGIANSLRRAGFARIHLAYLTSQFTTLISPSR
jgi:diaminopimelate decarboxylase